MGSVSLRAARFRAGLDYVDEVAVGAGLDSGGGDDEGVRPLLQDKADVDELVREEGAILVFEDGLGLDSPGGGVYLIVDCQERAAGKVSGLGAVEGFDNELAALAETLEDGGELVFRKREDHGDGLQLRDNEEAVGVGRMDDVAGVHLAQADDAVDGRRDSGVGDVDFGGLDSGAVGGEYAYTLAGRRDLDLLALL